MYKLLRSILFKIDAETVLNGMIGFGKAARPVAPIIFSLFRFEHPSLETEVFGLKFKNPIGLAPGFDKAGAFADTMAALGFGFVEIGSITPEPQAGNLRPRLFWRPAETAIVNRMGFNSIGMLGVGENLRRLGKRDFVLGINLGKNKITPNEAAFQDYRMGSEMLSPLADYTVINVSSPNTPDLRKLQEKEPLEKILRSISRTKPLILKVSPELGEGQLDEIAYLAMDLKLSAIIATNTIPTPDGAMSGEPLRRRSTEVISRLYKLLHGRVPIIGTGGIFSAKDAYDKIKAGANLIEIYTGLVYEGPMLVKRIKQGLVEMLKRDGFSSIGGAVGANHR